MKKNSGGFTLLEVVVFIGIFSMIYITITYASVIGIKNNKFNQHKIIATHYAEELSEWMRGEKDASWSGFMVSSQMNNIGIGETLSYCFNDNNLIWSSVTGVPPLPTPQVYQAECSAASYLNDNYQRNITLTKQTGSEGEIQIKTLITVFWREGNETPQVNLSTILGQYE